MAANPYGSLVRRKRRCGNCASPPMFAPSSSCRSPAVQDDAPRCAQWIRHSAVVSASARGIAGSSDSGPIGPSTKWRTCPSRPIKTDVGYPRTPPNASSDNSLGIGHTPITPAEWWTSVASNDATSTTIFYATAPLTHSLFGASDRADHRCPVLVGLAFEIVALDFVHLPLILT